jgi:hypothetical protein
VALPQVPASQSGDGVVIVAGLCRYDQVASGVTARGSRIAGPDDARLRSLIVAAVQELTQPGTGFRNEDGMGDTKGGDSM